MVWHFIIDLKFSFLSGIGRTGISFSSTGAFIRLDE
jgi:hypothetical protein